MKRLYEGIISGCIPKMIFYTYYVSYDDLQIDADSIIEIIVDAEDPLNEWDGLGQMA
ncbi:hypothetical protein YSY43_31390 [Paenibacillus sp. YSY-4.3]